MHRSFIDEEIKVGDKFILDEYKHMVSVLRMQEGDEFELVSPSGLFLCEIISIENPLRALAKSEILESSESPIKISLYQSLCKGAKFEHVIQKSIELGVHEIIPVETKRTIVRLEGKKKDKRIQRYRSIAEAASKQSKREYIPEVRDLVSLDEIDCEGLIMGYEEEGQSFKGALKGWDKDHISILIGPEGGFEKDEVESLSKRGAKIVNFGNRILRTETAGLFMISAIQYELGDMG